MKIKSMLLTSLLAAGLATSALAAPTVYLHFFNVNYTPAVNIDQEAVVVKNNLLPNHSKADKVTFSGNTFNVTDTKDANKNCHFALDQKTEHGKTIFVIKDAKCTESSKMVILGNAQSKDSLDLYIEKA